MKTLQQVLNEVYHNLLIKEDHVQKIKKEGGRYLGLGKYVKGNSLTTKPSYISNTGKREVKPPKTRFQDFHTSNEANRGSAREYVEDLHSHLLSNSEDPSSEGQKDALDNYTFDSTHINKYLHQKSQGHKTAQGDDSGAHAAMDVNIKHLDHFTESQKTQKAISVYSGLGRDPTESFNTNHKIVHVPRYLSTTIDSRAALGFSRSIADPTNRMEHVFHVLKINIPKGAPGAYIDHLSQQQNEKEFLMPRNCHLKLKGQHRDAVNPDVRVWEVDFLHNREPKKVKKETEKGLPGGDRYASGKTSVYESKFDMENWKNMEAEAEFAHENENNFEKRQPSLSPEQSSHVATYTNNSYSINKPLFDGKKLSPRGKEVSNGLSKMIATHKLSEPLTVFSGISFDPEERHQAWTNKKIFLPAFTSASILARRAERFAMVHFETKVDLDAAHVLRIDLPKGHPASFIANHSNFASEKEVLLDKGLHLKVKGKSVYNCRERGGSAKIHVWHTVPYTPKDK